MANPVPEDSATESAAGANKRVAAYFDADLTSLARCLKATGAAPAGWAFLMKGEMYNPKNPEYAAICDVESAKGAPNFVYMELYASNIAVSLEELGDARALPTDPRQGRVDHQLGFYGLSFSSFFRRTTRQVCFQ